MLDNSLIKFLYTNLNIASRSSRPPAGGRDDPIYFTVQKL